MAISDPFSGQMSQLYWGQGTGNPGDAAYQGLTKWDSRSGTQPVGEAFTDPNPKIQALIDAGLITRTAIGGPTSGGMQDYHYDLSPNIYGPGGAPAMATPPQQVNSAANSSPTQYQWGLIENSNNRGVGPTYNDPNYGTMGLFKTDNSLDTTGKIGEAITMAALASGFGYVGAGALGGLMGGSPIANIIGSLAGKTGLSSFLSGQAPSFGSGSGQTDPMSMIIGMLGKGGLDSVGGLQGLLQMLQGGG